MATDRGPLMFVSVVGLLLVPLIGVKSGGATRYLEIGPIPFQPSELAKLAFLLWGADLLARKSNLGQLDDWRHLLIPLLPGAGILCMLVMLGDDLGTTFLLLVIFLALLWVIGTPLRLYAGVLGMIGLVLLILIVVAGYRFHRLTLFLHPQGGPNGVDMQSIQGKWAVGSGGLFGVGLGASRQKWGYVPNDTTDFIFAILGEELGLVGTLCVSLLYGGLAFAGIFGVFLPTGEDRLSAEEQALLDERQEARRNREFSQADEARRRLEEKGIVLEDTPKGTRWRRKR